MIHAGTVKTGVYKELDAAGGNKERQFCERYVQLARFSQVLFNTNF